MKVRKLLSLGALNAIFPAGLTAAENTPTASPHTNAEPKKPEDAGATAVLLQAGAQTWEATLNQSKASAALIRALPVTLPMNRWGGEYYGALPVPIPSGEEKREVFAVGELALWPAGNALCIFFGPTPASQGNEPRMASPGVPMGRITTDVDTLKKLGAKISMTISLKEKQTDR